VNELYGALRYGTLLEALLFESRRFTTLTGPDAVMIHPQAEKWLTDRMQAEEARHILNLPATVFGWSAGKWMEWYPDLRGKDGRLTTENAKYQWQQGWFEQHNRLLAAASAMKHSAPLFICGDLHNQTEGWITRSGDLDLSANPVISICSGSLGTGPRMWPSAFRGLVAEPPTAIDMQEKLAPVEKNGFVIVDVYPEEIRVSFYAWRQPEPEAAIDTLEPYHVVNLQRK
jgi:phosphodiesterase/alkaline phosphatase D-like protein